MRIVDKNIKSIEEMIHSLKEDTKDITGPIWYRGQSNVTYKLLPLSVRKKYDSEMSLIKKFKQDAMLLVNPRPVNTFEWLFIMRHYGVPTRLIDWSESPLSALYFSVISENNTDKDGALWALLPLELNKEGGRLFDDPDTLPSFEEDDIMNIYDPENFSKDKTEGVLPIAFIAPRNTPRMQSQLSVFTIHHRQSIALEDIGSRVHIWRYCVPKECKEAIKKELSLLGMGKFQMFPELQSIGEILQGDK